MRATLALIVAVPFFLVPAMAVAAAPGAATLLGPAGAITGSTVAFTWQAVAGATFYYVQVNDATAAPRFTAWYPAGQVCAAGSATCAAIFTTGWAVGAGTWWVQTWNPDGFGPWSSGMAFTVTHVAGAWAANFAGADRFQLVMDGTAVLDRETGLVWERTPVVATSTWLGSIILCPFSGAGNRRGWRLPTVDELATLIDSSAVAAPSLPPGHPFGLGASPAFWTATVNANGTTHAFTVDFTGGGMPFQVKSGSYRRWCVRGGGPTPQGPQ